uniref:Uncharacterized protein n=1 Tax=viral metagenome TaxID=1070528 RepID=A0A6C0JTZ9_9ZZZZ
MSYYYWDDEMTNKKGETLQQCFEKYGTGVQKDKLDNIKFIMDVVYLDDTYSFGYSWCLRMIDARTRKNIKMRQYEQHACPGVHALNPIVTSV